MFKEGNKSYFAYLFHILEEYIPCIIRGDFAQNLIILFRACLHKLLTSTWGQKLGKSGWGWWKPGLAGAKSRENEMPFQMNPTTWESDAEKKTRVLGIITLAASRGLLIQRSLDLSVTGNSARSKKSFIFCGTMGKVLPWHEQKLTPGNVHLLILGHPSTASHSKQFFWPHKARFLSALGSMSQIAFPWDCCPRGSLLQTTSFQIQDG